MWVALLAGVCALLCALGAAWGPASAERAEVSWPARTDAPTAADESARPALWYAPLLLSAHTAQRLHVELPCTVAPAEAPALVFGTARQAEEVWGLGITAAAGTLTLRVGTDTIASVPWGPATDACAARLEFDDTAWRLTRDGTEFASGDHGAPAVSGFWTELPPDARGALHAELVTRTYSSAPSARQVALTVLAVLFAGAALLLLAPRRHGSARADAPRLVRPRAGALDAGVVAALVAWWALGPWFYDDGWLMATVRARQSGGSFSNYYDTLATQMPLGFAHHMLLSPFAAVDAPFLWWRLVPLAACVGTWALLRVALANLERPDQGRLARVTLAVAFSVFAFAWLMTLRPEPVVSLLSAVVLVGVLAYRRSMSRLGLSLALVGAAVAATLHPSGFVAGAPLVAALPTLWRDVRRGVRATADVATAVLLGVTAGVLLLFADTDVSRWREARAIFSQDGFHSGGVLQETLRYHDLLTNGSIPGLASVLFAAAALLSFAVATVRVATRRRRFTERDIAGLSLLVAALLLTTTPSKWVYHFGSGAAVATLAIAVETSRVARVRGRAGVWLRGAVVVLVALLLARSFRNPGDAQYFLHVRTAVAPVLGNALLWLGVAAAVLLIGRTLRRALMVDQDRVFAAAVPIGLAVVVAVTAVTFAAVPLVRGPWWAFSRTAWHDALQGGCTFGDRIEVSDPRDGAPLIPGDADPSALSTADASQLHRLPPEIGSAHVFGTDIAGDEAIGELITPWYDVRAVDADDDIAVAVGGRMGYERTRLEVEWATSGDGGREVMARGDVVVKRNPGLVYGQQPWRMVRMRPPDGAKELRLIGYDDASEPGGNLAFSAPIALAPSRSLSSYLSGNTTLISPPELPLLRCSEPASIRGGIAQMPDVVVGFQYDTAGREISELGSETGPWYLAEDAHPTRRLWAWLTDRDAVSVTMPDDEALIGRLLPADIRYVVGS